MNRRYSSALKRVLNKTMLRWIEMVSRQTQSTQCTVQYAYLVQSWDPGSLCCVMISVSCGLLPTLVLYCVQNCTLLDVVVLNLGLFGCSQENCECI